MPAISSAMPRYACRVRETATPDDDVSSASTAPSRSLIELFFEARHQLREIARPRAEVELRRDQLVPTGCAGARRARQAEDIGGVRDTGETARLQARRADLLVRDRAEQLAEAVDLFVEQHSDRLRRSVAAREARAARRDDDLDFLVGDPRRHYSADRV